MQAVQAVKALASLVATFNRDVEIARSLKTPNEQDNLPIRVAIIGFSYNSPVTSWGFSHYQFVQRLVEGEYSLGELAFYAPKEEQIQRFAMLCFGYLLGSYEADKLSDHEFALGEALIPGLIASNAPDLMK